MRSLCRHGRPVCVECSNTLVAATTDAEKEAYSARCRKAIDWLEAHGWSEVAGRPVFGVQRTSDALGSIEAAMRCDECARPNEPCSRHGLDTLVARQTGGAVE